MIGTHRQDHNHACDVRTSDVGCCNQLRSDAVGRLSSLAFGTFDYVVTIAVALLFLTSGITHLINPYYFLSVVYDYELTGRNFGIVIAALVPFAQLVAAVFLLARFRIMGAIGLAILLLGTFAYAQYHALRHGLQISCGCFGATSLAQVNYASLAFVLVLLTGCLLIFCVRLWSFPRRCQPAC